MKPFLRSCLGSNQHLALSLAITLYFNIGYVQQTKFAWGHTKFFNVKVIDYKIQI